MEIDQGSRPGADRQRAYNVAANAWLPVQSTADGAAHVSVRESSVGPEGAGNADHLTVNAVSGADDLSAAIVGDQIDLVIIGSSLADGVRVEIGSAPTTSANSPVYAPGSYRFPITSGNKVAVRSNDANTGTAHVNPVI